MTRPASRAKGVTKSRGSGRVGPLRFKISRVGSGQAGQEVSKSRGSGRVGSIGFKISRVGSGRVNSFSKSRWSGRVMIREIRVTRGSIHNDPGVVFGRPAGRIRGFTLRICLFQSYTWLSAGGSWSSCRRLAGRTRGSDPRVRK